MEGRTMPRLLSLAGKPRSAFRRTVCLCVKCREYKPRELFYKNKLTANGVSSYCKQCYQEYYQQRKRARKEANGDQDSIHRERP